MFFKSTILWVPNVWKLYEIQIRIWMNPSNVLSPNQKHNLTSLNSYMISFL